MSKRILIPLLIACAWVMLGSRASSAAAADTPAPAPAPVTYSRVHAVFAKHCLSCHDRKEAEGELVMESFESLMKGGDKGAEIVPGKADESRLVQLIERTKKPYMPPPKKGDKLPDAEIALIKAWINAGAPGPKPGEVLPVVTPAVTLPKIEPKGTPRRPVQAVVYSPQANALAIARAGEVELRSPDGQALLHKLAGHIGNVNDLAFTPDGSKLAAAAGEPGRAGAVRLWNVADGKPIKVFDGPGGHKDAAYAVAVSPDGRTIASGSYDQRIILWDVESGRPQRTLEGHNGAIFGLAFRNDGRVLASASADRTLKLWEVATGKRLDTRPESLKELQTLAFTPEGRRVIAGGVDNRLRVWQISPEATEGTNTLLLSQFAHEGAILKLALSPDGKSLVSSADDRTVKLWELPNLTQKQSLPAQPDWPSAVAFGPEGKTVIVGRQDGSVGFYDAGTGKEILPPKPELAEVVPPGVQRGKSSKLKVLGKGLGQLTAAKVAGAPDSKLTAKVLTDEPAKPDLAWVEVTAVADLAPGAYDLTVSGPGGASKAVKLYADTLPQVAEQEPNDSASQATRLELPADAWGQFDRRGDADCFAFDAKSGETIVFDVAARRIGSKASVVLTLLDSAGRVLASASAFDDDPDPLLAHAFAAGGRYVVRVTDLLNGASKEHFYRLSAGSFAQVTGVFPLGVPANAESPIRLIGHTLPPDAAVAVKAGGPGEADVPLDVEQYRSRRAFRVITSATPEATEAEPNDRPEQANVIAVPGAVSGRIDATKEGTPDADFYRFDAKAGQTYVVETVARRRGSPVDTRVEVLWPDGKPVQRVQLRAVRDSYINFRAIDAVGDGARFANWEEMDLNQYMYMSGEVVRLFLAPRGPDSDYNFYKAANNKRRCYFDTTATSHALDEKTYIVEPHPVGERLPANGLPVFALNYANDDAADRMLGADSRLLFTAPKDGNYVIRVTDTRGTGAGGGDRFVYRLVVRPANPDFTVSFDVANPPVPTGGGRGFTVRVDRIDGFDGPVRVDLTGAPAGFLVTSPIVIEAGHLEAKGLVYAAPDAKSPAAEAGVIKATATATVDGKSVTKPAPDLGRPAVAPKLQVGVGLTPATGPIGSAGTKPATQPAVDLATVPEITITPGKMLPAWLRIERNKFAGPVSFDVENLPHGAIVADIGLNGVLIPDGQSERQIFLQCAPWVAETDRLCYARAREAGNPTSVPVLVHVRR